MISQQVDTIHCLIWLLDFVIRWSRFTVYFFVRGISIFTLLYSIYYVACIEPAWGLKADLQLQQPRWPMPVYAFIHTVFLQERLPPGLRLIVQLWKRSITQKEQRLVWRCVYSSQSTVLAPALSTGRSWKCNAMPPSWTITVVVVNWYISREVHIRATAKATA